MAATTPRFDRGDWLGLAAFLAPIAFTLIHWLAGAVL